MKKIVLRIFVFLLFIPVSIFANAKAQEVIKQRQNLESQKEQFKKLEQNSNEKIFFYDTQKPRIEDIKKGRCVQIKKIEEDSITLLSQKEKETIFRKYENSCRTLGELNNLTKELTKLYIDKGYVTSQVYFKAQKIQNGILKLHAVEGKINKVIPQEKYVKNAFLGLEEQFLNLRDLETSIESINRLPSNKATMKLVPSSETGKTDIQIENETTSRLNGSIGIDNYGSKKVGKFQGSTNINLDNPLGINDQFSLSLNSTHKHRKKENSKGNGFKYSFPIGNRLLNTIGYRKTSYEQFIKVGVNQYKTNGDTNTASFDMKYKLFHNKKNRVNLGAFVARYDTRNYLAGAQIEASSYSLSKKGVSLDYLYQTQGFYTSLSSSYTKGTSWFGTHNPTVLNDKFSLYTADLSVMKQVLDFQYSLNTHYQKTNDALFGNDQISIGGAYSVRGYNKEGLSGNSGYYIRNELEKQLKLKLFDVVTQKYFLAFDYGSIKKEEDVDGGKLASYSFGAKYFYKEFSMQTYYAIPIRDKDVSDTNRFFGISLGYRF